MATENKITEIGVMGRAIKSARNNRPGQIDPRQEVFFRIVFPQIAGSKRADDIGHGPIKEMASAPRREGGGDAHGIERTTGHDGGRRVR